MFGKTTHPLPQNPPLPPNSACGAGELWGHAEWLCRFTFMSLPARVRTQVHFQPGWADDVNRTFSKRKWVRPGPLLIISDDAAGAKDVVLSQPLVGVVNARVGIRLVRPGDDGV